VNQYADGDADFPSLPVQSPDKVTILGSPGTNNSLIGR
jgi:hypothetical protein